MKRCLIVGKANAGKSLFFLNFAEFLGAREVEVVGMTGAWGEGGAGEGGTGLASARVPVALARHRLVGGRPHTTRQLQALALALPGGKGSYRFLLTDTPGLSDGIHPDPEVRAGMALTLQSLSQAHLVLHVVDAAAVGLAGPRAEIGPVDWQLSRFAPLHAAYLLLANKIDLPWAQAGVLKLQESLGRGRRLIPISALERRGFHEVRSHVWQLL